MVYLECFSIFLIATQIHPLLNHFSRGFPALLHEPGMHPTPALQAGFTDWGLIHLLSQAWPWRKCPRYKPRALYPDALNLLGVLKHSGSNSQGGVLKLGRAVAR